MQSMCIAHVSTCENSHLQDYLLQEPSPRMQVAYNISFLEWVFQMSQCGFEKYLTALL